MLTKTHSLLRIAACSAAVGLLHAGDFAAPTEGPVAFRRDQVPLDADAMAGLSRQLEILTRALKTDTPTERRAAAQMLALSIALDPGNSNARSLITDLEEGRHKPSVEPDKLERARARIWQIVTWLESAEAGAQGHSLAACLKDIIAISDPKHPRSAAIREAGEKGAWTGWIPPLSAYEPKPVEPTEDPVNPVPEVPPAEPTSIRLETASLDTLLWQRAGKKETDPWILGRAPLVMTAVQIKKDEEGADRFQLSIGNGPESGAGQAVEVIRSVLKNTFEKLPHGVRIRITSPLFETMAPGQGGRKRQPISAAAAVLAHAALSGNAPDAIVLGQVDESGAFKTSSSFWDQLQSLGPGKGQRLVLPAESAPYLSSILALEKPEFFLEYEVLIASDFKQLTELATKTPEGALASGITRFREIRERAGTQDVRLYIANTFVKQRLATVLQDVPQHVSAKLLLIQAAGNRPILVARPVLASELRRALDPMSWILDVNHVEIDEDSANKLGQTYDTCRTRVEGLDRYAEKSDRALVEQCRSLLVSLRSLEKAARSRGEPYIITSNIQSARMEVVRVAKDLRNELSIEAGDPPAPGN